VVSIQVSQKANSTPLTQMPDFPFVSSSAIHRIRFAAAAVTQEQFRHGAGSGFVWDKEGHINHQ